MYSQIRKKSKKSLVGEYFLPLAKVFGEFLYDNYYFITTFTEPEIFVLNLINQTSCVIISHYQPQAYTATAVTGLSQAYRLVTSIYSDCCNRLVAAAAHLKTLSWLRNTKSLRQLIENARGG